MSGLILDALPLTIECSGKPTIDNLKYPTGQRASTKRVALSSPASGAAERKCMRSLKAGPVFRLEKISRRDAYHDADEASKQPPPGDGERGGYWEGLPETPSPGFDVDAVRDMVTLAVPRKGKRIYPSKSRQNAGGYFCEFEFYSSLAELHKRGEFKRVEFLHTLAKDGERDIQNRVRVAVALICVL